MKMFFFSQKSAENLANLGWETQNQFATALLYSYVPLEMFFSM